MKNFTTQSGDKKLTEIVHQLQAQSKALIRLGNLKQKESEIEVKVLSGRFPLLSTALRTEM